MQDSRKILYKFVSRSFATAISAFKNLFVIFIIVNLPLIVIKLYPASEELQKYQNSDNDVIPCDVERQEELRNSFHSVRTAGTRKSDGRASAASGTRDSDSRASVASGLRNSDTAEKVTFRTTIPIGNGIREADVEALAEGDPHTISLNMQQDEEGEKVAMTTLPANGHAAIDEDAPMMPKKMRDPNQTRHSNVIAEIFGRSRSTIKRQREREREEMYTPLDGHTPSLNLLGVFSVQITLFSPAVNFFLSWFRRFLLFFLFFTHVVFFAVILDQLQHQDTITKLLSFHDEYSVDMKDLRFWNVLFHGQWNNLHGILYPLWIISLAILSHPQMMQFYLEHMMPSKYFGVCQIDSLWPQSFHHLDGLRKIGRAMELRMGFFYRKSFWTMILRSIFGPDIPFATRLKNFFFNLVSCLTFFPLLAPLVPMLKKIKKMWIDLANRDWRPAAEKLGFLLFISVFYALAAFFIYENVLIYSMFVTFTLTSTIFHYQQSLNVIGVIAGGLTFLIKLLTQMKNKYISLKMLTVEVAKEVHEAKMEEARNHGFETSSTSFQSVPQLVWFSRTGLPYIPIKLYRRVIQEIQPIGPERAMLVVKLVVMTVFVVFIYSIMRALRMNEENAAFDMAQAVLTVVAVVIPSLLANLQSDVEKVLEREQHKYMIQRMIGEFLKENKKFYRFEEGQETPADVIENAPLQSHETSMVEFPKKLRKF